MSDRPFLVTGCGRSGTRWAAHLFTEMGYPCGHEETFNLESAGPLIRADSSWLAVPHLDSLPADTPIIHVVRDPFLVVRSIIVRGFLWRTDAPYESYVAKHRPDITSASSHLGRAIRWASLWDEPVTEKPARLLRLGDVDPNLIQYTSAFHHTVGEQPGTEELRMTLRKLGRTINTNPGSSRVVPPSREKILAHPDAHLLSARAEKYGYGG